METERNNEKVFQDIIKAEGFYEEEDDYNFGNAYTSMTLPIIALVLSIMTLLGEIAIIVTPAQWDTVGTLWVFLLSLFLIIAPMWMFSMMIVIMERKEHVKKLNLFL